MRAGQLDDAVKPPHTVTGKANGEETGKEACKETGKETGKEAGSDFKPSSDHMLVTADLTHVSSNESWYSAKSSLEEETQQQVKVRLD